MIKSFLKALFHKAYLIGKYEDLRLEHINRQKQFDEIAEFQDNVFIGDKANLVNYSKKKHKLKIGQHSRILGELSIFPNNGEISIGEYCFIGENSKIWSAGKITIGNRVLIAHNVNIHDNISHPLNSEQRHIDFKNFTEKGFLHYTDLHEKAVIIEDDVWIGFNSTILKGVVLGKGSIIGANTVVTKSVPEYAVVVGNPAQIIKYTS
jgi:acetyltransferase-like isoleucine patch superfamily enzyme